MVVDNYMRELCSYQTSQSQIAVVVFAIIFIITNIIVFPKSRLF